MPDANDALNVTFDERTPYTRIDTPQQGARTTDLMERLVVSGFAKDVASARKITFVAVVTLGIIILSSALAMQVRGPAAPEVPIEPQGLTVEPIR